MQQGPGQRQQDRTELAGYLYLRLDCWRDNSDLHNCYLKRDFRYLEPPGPHSTHMSGALAEAPPSPSPPRLIDDNLGHQFHPVPGVPLSQPGN